MKLIGIDPDHQHKAIARWFNNCPPHMLVREYTQNAIEAGATEIFWRAVVVDGTPKLSVVNNAPGMMPTEMDRLLRSVMGSGEGKSEENKGLGARMAGLRSNPHGVVYYSAVGKRVHKLRLYYAGDDHWASDDIVEATQEARALFGLNFIAKGGTGVVFMGRDARHDTTREPFEDGTQNDFYKCVDRRFFRLPEGTSILTNIVPKTAEKTQYRAKGLHLILAKHICDYKKVEVATPEGMVTVHYYLHPEGFTGTRVGSLRTGRSVAGIVWRNEVYDIRAEESATRKSWTEEARAYGMFGIHDRISIMVELGEGFDVYAQDDRAAIIRAGGGERFELRQFAEIIADNLPESIKAVRDAERKRHAPKSEEAIKREIHALMRELGLVEEQLVETQKAPTIPTERDPKVLVFRRGSRNGGGGKRERLRPALRRVADGELNATIARIVREHPPVVAVYDRPMEFFCEVGKCGEDVKRIDMIAYNGNDVRVARCIEKGIAKWIGTPEEEEAREIGRDTVERVMCSLALLPWLMLLTQMRDYEVRAVDLRRAIEDGPYSVAVGAVVQSELSERVRVAVTARVGNARRIV